MAKLLSSRNDIEVTQKVTCKYCKAEFLIWAKDITDVIDDGPLKAVIECPNCTNKFTIEESKITNTIVKQGYWKFISGIK